MHYAGIDPSLRGTGIVVIDSKKIIIESLLIKTISKQTLEERMLKICIEIFSLLENYKNIVVGIEGLGFGCRGQRMFELAGLHYCITTMLTREKINFIKIPPSVLKKFVSGKGNAKKELMMKDIYKKWGIDFNDNNLADAFALAMFCIQKEE